MATQGKKGGQKPQRRNHQAEEQQDTNAARQRAQNNLLELHQPDGRRPKTPPRRCRTPPPPKSPSFFDLALTACLCLPFPIVARGPSPPIAAARPDNRDDGRVKSAPPTPQVPTPHEGDPKTSELAEQLRNEAQKLKQKEQEQKKREQKVREQKEREEKEQERQERQTSPTSPPTQESPNVQEKETAPEQDPNSQAETDDSGPEGPELNDETNDSGPDTEPAGTESQPESEPNNCQGKKSNKTDKGKSVAPYNNKNNDNAAADNARVGQSRRRGITGPSQAMMTSALSTNTPAHAQPATSVMSDDDKVISLSNPSFVTTPLDITLKEQPPASASLIYGETGFAPVPIPQRHGNTSHEERDYNLGGLGGWKCRRPEEWTLNHLAPSGLAREASSSLSLLFPPATNNTISRSNNGSNNRDSIDTTLSGSVAARLGAWRTRSTSAWGSAHISSSSDDDDANDPFTEPGSIARNTPRPRWHY